MVQQNKISENLWMRKERVNRLSEEIAYRLIDKEMLAAALPQTKNNCQQCKKETL